MVLEELIYNRLKKYEPLTNLLCKYDGEPAVFYQTAPDDKQKGWGQGNQYPRLVFDLDMQANTERRSSGTLLAAVFCDRVGTEPEQIEPMVRECLKDIFIKPADSFPYCFAWARTDAFDLGGGLDQGGTKQRAVIGEDIRFDILEFPIQETTDPDPVAALNLYLQEMLPEAYVVGITHMDEITVAEPKKPVLYCRLLGMEEASVTNTVIWVNARVAIHVICPSAEMRLKIAADIAYRMTAKAEIIMLDHSPMRPTRLAVDNTTDYMRTGQISTTLYYGLLRWKPQPHTIMEVNISLNNIEEV